MFVKWDFIGLSNNGIGKSYVHKKNTKLKFKDKKGLHWQKIHILKNMTNFKFIKILSKYLVHSVITT